MHVHDLRSGNIWYFHIIRGQQLILSATQIGHRSVLDQDGELTKVLESLVNDNETLKRDNAELQRFLAEAREDLHALQEEVEEQRAHPPSQLGGKKSSLLGILWR